VKRSAADRFGTGRLRGDRHRIRAVVDVDLVRKGCGHPDDHDDQQECEQIGFSTVALVSHGRTEEHCK